MLDKMQTKIEFFFAKTEVLRHQSLGIRNAGLIVISQMSMGITIFLQTSTELVSIAT